MTLTVGSTLQNGKYVIGSTLHQSDFGVTYQATHAYLQQPVIVQTFNECLRDHSNFVQLCQLFLDEVRHRSSTNATQVFKILDGFEEAGMPYVVLQPNPDHAYPKLRDWLPLTRLIVKQPPRPNGVAAAANQASAVDKDGADKRASATPLTALHPPSSDRNLPQPNVSLPAKSESEVNLAVQSLSAVPIEQSSPVTTSLAEKTQVVAPKAQSQAQSPAQSFVFPTGRRSRPWLPTALMATAVLAGLTGAGLGWVVRFEQLGQAEGDAAGFGFGKDQDFPPLQEWPITGESEVEALQALPSERVRVDREPRQARPRQARTPVEVVPESYDYQEPAIAPVEESPEIAPSKIEPSDVTSDTPLPEKEPPVVAPDPVPVEPAPPPVYSPEPPANPIDIPVAPPVIPKAEDLSPPE